jgi:nucleoid-associated protein YgaU
LLDAAPDASFRFISGPAQDAQDLEAAPAPSWSYDQPAPVELVSRGGASTTSHADNASRVEGAMAADGASLADGVVVHRGDNLWSIAARHLGPSATAADIDAEWHRWYVANRDVIGADANLLHPGQRLACPATSQENS